MKVIELVAKLQKVFDSNSKLEDADITKEQVGALLSVRNCNISEETTGFEPEYAFTLRQWRNLEEYGSTIDNDTFLEIFPHLERLV